MIHLQVLGEPGIRCESVPLPPFKSRKVLALLVYLALNPGTHARSRLAGLLWSDSPEKKALGNLRFALWNITEVLGLQVFETDRLSVTWQQRPDISLDVEEFLTALWQARPEHAETPEVISALEQAVQMYRGDLLAGFDLPDNVLFNEWLQQQRAYLHALAVEALYRLARHYLAHRRLPAAIATARRLLELEPWHEEAHRLLMLALARSGQRSAALAQYIACRRVLSSELETTPAAQTVRLYEQIRAADAAPRHDLPVPLTPFVGRAKELDELLRWLDDPQCRLITLVGPGGAGKTRLAQQAATARADAFLNGVAWIGFEAVDSPARLFPTIAEHFGIEWRANNLMERLGHFLSDKEMLLLLDNLEQLRAGAGQLAELLRQAPQVKILVTSRERLNLQCEWVFPVDGLSFPPAETADIAAFDAVQLFLHTARRANPRFALDSSNVPAIRRICRSVDGLPLALELAAALLPALSCEAIAQTLEETLSILETTAPDVPPRHRSLRAVLASSWEALSDAERAAVRRLSVFRGGFRQAAAERVTGVTRPRLSALVDASWLRLTADGRYEMLETVRQFALEEQRATEDWATIQDAHACYFADLLAEQRAALHLSQSAALAQVGEEIENIRAAWRWAVQHGAVDVLTRAADGLGVFLELRSWFQEGAEIFGSAHDLAVQAGGIDGALLLAWAGLFAFRLADYSRAQAVLERARVSLQTEHAPGVAAFVFNNLGLVADRLGQREGARVWFTASIHQARLAGDDRALARALSNLGYLFYLDGDYGQAQMLIEQALSIRRSQDDRLGTAKTLIPLALVWQALQEDDRLQAAYQESLALFRELGNRLGVAICLNNLGFHAFRRQRYAEARQLYEDALLIRRELGDLWGVAIALDNLGAVASELGEYAAAHAYYAEALSAARVIEATRLLVEIQVGLARLAAREGNPTRAVELLAFALAHPALGSEARESATRLLAELEGRLPPPEFDAAVTRGKALALEPLVEQVLTHNP
ncbi:MAG TPA: BTAD domain-containing putative transcriptional regulator [Anaerolineae bacterium]|nr:BTAD domain-containing putative transcriptional regulator [Anaerolineae bacterium]HQK12682.1 BTAD domain-containing putative transcriptional regulator [Anaerolineae bacterium]